MPARHHACSLQRTVRSKFIRHSVNRFAARHKQTRIGVDIVLLSTYRLPARINHSVLRVRPAAAVHINEAHAHVSRVRINIPPRSFNLVQSVRNHSVLSAPDPFSIAQLLPSACPQRSGFLIQIVPISTNWLQSFLHLAVAVVIILLPIDLMPARHHACSLQRTVRSKFIRHSVNRFAARHKQTRIGVDIVLLSTYRLPARINHSVLRVRPAAAVHINEAHAHVSRVRINIPPRSFNLVQSVRNHSVLSAPDPFSIAQLLPSACPQRSGFLIQIVPISTNWLQSFLHLAVAVVIILLPRFFDPTTSLFFIVIRLHFIHIGF